MPSMKSHYAGLFNVNSELLGKFRVNLISTILLVLLYCSRTQEASNQPQWITWVPEEGSSTLCLVTSLLSLVAVGESHDSKSCTIEGNKIILSFHAKLCSCPFTWEICCKLCSHWHLRWANPKLTSLRVAALQSRPIIFRDSLRSFSMVLHCSKCNRLNFNAINYDKIIIFQQDACYVTSWVCLLVIGGCCRVW